MKKTEPPSGKKKKQEPKTLKYLYRINTCFRRTLRLQSKGVVS